MKRISTLIAMFLMAAVLTLPWMSQASAQSVGTFLSSAGSDGNNCTSTATACQTFGGALGKTLENGTVMCVGAGYFGTLDITKGITIDCLAGGNGINTQLVTINAPGKTVRLRNLGMNGIGNVSPVVDIAAASQVYMENVYVTESLNRPGILDHRTGPALLAIKNSSVIKVEGPGIVIAPASGIIGVDLENVTSAYNTFGLAVGNGGRVTIKNSFFTNNSVAGIESDGGTFLNINGSQVAFNETGVLSHGSTALSLSQIVSNTTAISGATQSTGNNLIFGNSSDGTTPTIISSR